MQLFYRYIYIYIYIYNIYIYKYIDSFQMKSLEKSDLKYVNIL